MKQEADLLIANAVIYTVDESFSIAEAMAIKDCRILAVGTDREIAGRYRSANVLDLDGKYIYPGWIDPHCHFYGYGLTLADADLSGTTSPEQIIDILIEYEKDSPGSWLTGRGWDQNDWIKKDFPCNAEPIMI